MIAEIDAMNVEFFPKIDFTQPDWPFELFSFEKCLDWHISALPETTQAYFRVQCFMKEIFNKYLVVQIAELTTRRYFSTVIVSSVSSHRKPFSAQRG